MIRHFIFFVLTNQNFIEMKKIFTILFVASNIIYSAQVMAQSAPANANKVLSQTYIRKVVIASGARSSGSGFVASATLGQPLAGFRQANNQCAALTVGVQYGNGINTPCTVGINNLNNASQAYLIYPNPFSNEFSIKYEGKLKDQERTIFIKDLAGRLIYENKSTSSNADHIDLSALADGMYFVSVLGDDNKNILSQRVVKQ